MNSRIITPGINDKNGQAGVKRRLPIFSNLRPLPESGRGPGGLVALFNPNYFNPYTIVTVVEICIEPACTGTLAGAAMTSALAYWTVIGALLS